MGSSYEMAFTVTLKPKLYDYRATEQYDLSFQQIFEKLLLLSYKNQFTLVAELTKNFNIHYHGIVKMPLEGKSCMKKFHDAFRGSKLFGFVNIKQITEQPIWIEYISKEIGNTRDLVSRPPVIYDYFSYIKTGALTNVISHISECYD